MITQINQRTYKCSYCGRRTLSKNGCKIHEKEYCKDERSPHIIALKLRREKCPHKNTDTQYSYIPGEAVKEPAYDLCLDCGVRL